jgi:hypothetical protein
MNQSVEEDQYKNLRTPFFRSESIEAQHGSL